MDTSHLAELTGGLKGLTYFEWTHLRMTVDAYFEAKKRELERQLKLSDDETLQRVIHAQSV